MISDTQPDSSNNRPSCIPSGGARDPFRRPPLDLPFGEPSVGASANAFRTPSAKETACLAGDSRAGPSRLPRLTFSGLAVWAVEL